MNQFLWYYTEILQFLGNHKTDQSKIVLHGLIRLNNLPTITFVWNPIVFKINLIRCYSDFVRCVILNRVFMFHSIIVFQILIGTKLNKI
jgi:hypothetical protein